jgi:outer membrane murein-binding lipoprotein Lpp
MQRAEAGVWYAAMVSTAPPSTVRASDLPETTARRRGTVRALRHATMKKLMKIVSILFTVVMSVFALSGCVGDAFEDEAPSQDSQPAVTDEVDVDVDQDTTTPTRAVIRNVGC